VSAITPDRWSEVEQFYHAALECKPEERLAFLKHICRDEQLRREVQSLLEHEQEGDQLLEDRPWQPGISEDSDPSLSAGARLGPYEILARIGAGGMGEVYQARDKRLDRKVAIKISAKQFSDRFEREARRGPQPSTHLHAA
jgi:serine/threonine protein kinase